METPKPEQSRARPIVVMAVISLLVCGLLFPLFVTGVAQLAFPYQANGELVHVGGRTVGSMVSLNYTDYTAPVFFQPRNDTASGFDPTITLADALAQVPRISEATGIQQESLDALVNGNVQGVWWVFGYPYVNVQKLNVLLVADYPGDYSAYG